MDASVFALAVFPLSAGNVKRGQMPHESSFEIIEVASAKAVRVSGSSPAKRRKCFFDLSEGRHLTRSVDAERKRLAGAAHHSKGGTTLTTGSPPYTGHHEFEGILRTILVNILCHSTQ